VTVVLPIGRVGCGKTTLITTIYDQFQLGPFSGWMFAGSDTLLGFERRSWTSRSESGRETADTERTKVRLGERFLHLRLQDEGQAVEPVDLLLVDASGELFQRLVDYPDESPRLVSLVRADVVALLVDGEQIANAKGRHAVLHDAHMQLRAISEKQILKRGARLQLIVTKWDLIDAAGVSKEILHNQIVEAVLENLSGEVDIELLVTAARPLPLKVPWGFGCAEVLNSWLKPTITARVSPIATEPASNRQFDTYGHVVEAR